MSRLLVSEREKNLFGALKHIQFQVRKEIQILIKEQKEQGVAPALHCSTYLN
jgi:hypothetical protein